MAGPLVRFLAERAKKYPDALTFGATFPVWLAKEAQERLAARDPSFTPATCVSDHMLDSDRLRTASGAPWFAPRTDFNFSLWYRARDDASRMEGIIDEAHAYVDAVVLFVGASQWLMSGRPATALLEIVTQWPAFTALESATREHAEQFVRSQDRWAKFAVRREDVADSRGFMDTLVSVADATSARTPRPRGLRTARDTLLLHVDYVKAILNGELSFGRAKPV